MLYSRVQLHLSTPHACLSTPHNHCIASDPPIKVITSSSSVHHLHSTARQAKSHGPQRSHACPVDDSINSRHNIVHGAALASCCWCRLCCRSCRRGERLLLRLLLRVLRQRASCKAAGACGLTQCLWQKARRASKGEQLSAHAAVMLLLLLLCGRICMKKAENGSACGLIVRFTDMTPGTCESSAA
jgi:hypothetical protein